MKKRIYVYGGILLTTLFLTACQNDPNSGADRVVPVSNEAEATITSNVSDEVVYPSVELPPSPAALFVNKNARSAGQPSNLPPGAGNSQ